MDKSIRDLKDEALGALLQQQYSLAADRFSNMISMAHGEKSDEEVSQMFTDRAACFFLWGKYDLALIDVQKALELNESNVMGYVEKYKILVKLNKRNEAQNVLKQGRLIVGDKDEFTECERHVNSSWFTRSRSGLKWIASVGVGVVTGLLVNQLSAYSPIKQGIIAGSVSAFILFVHLGKLWIFIKNMWCACLRIPRNFANAIQNVILNIWENHGTTRSNNGASSDTTRF